MKSKSVINFLLAALFLPIQIFAQGISFDQSRSWAEVLKKAKDENKYIFVDCYATWCGPCKQMDKLTYPEKKVGDFMNPRLISIKIQLDSTAKDDDFVKGWRNDVRNLGMTYQIQSLPTFLFFSPDGALVHKGIGLLWEDQFIALAKAAIDPEKQYYPALTAFKQGTLSFPKMPVLASTARDLGEVTIARSVSDRYIQHLLDQTGDSLYQKRNMQFIAMFTTSSNRRGFDFFYKNSDKIDILMDKKGYTWDVLDQIIQRENIEAQIYKDGKPLDLSPHWQELFQEIKKKYDAGYADRTILWSKILWYFQKKDFKKFCENYIIRVKKYGPFIRQLPYEALPQENLITRNSAAWDIFLFSNDKDQIKLALKWSDQVLKNKSGEQEHDRAGHVDTYANLLYKLGRKQEAIALEEQAVAQSKPPFTRSFQVTLESMKKDEPTWPKLN
jgi:thioredoxin-related protein